MNFSHYLASHYCSYERGEIDWLTFLKKMVTKRLEMDSDPHPFDEFLEIMEQTAYPEEKLSYQVVEVHCTYAENIQKERGRSV